MQGFVNISTQLLLSLLKGLREGDEPRAFRVLSGGVPQDAKFLGIQLPDGWRQVRLVFESDSLEHEHQEFLPVLTSDPLSGSANPTSRRYRKKLVVVEAVQWLGDMRPIIDMLGQDLPTAGGGALWVMTNHGGVRAEMCDWIIKGLNGEIYPCSEELFPQLYEPETEG